MSSPLLRRSTTPATDGFITALIFISIAVIVCIIHSGRVLRRPDGCPKEQDEPTPTFSEAVMVAGVGLQWRNISPLSAAVIRAESKYRPMTTPPHARPWYSKLKRPSHPHDPTFTDEPLEALQVAVIIAMPHSRPSLPNASYDIGVAHTIPWEAKVY